MHGGSSLRKEGREAKNTELANFIQFALKFTQERKIIPRQCLRQSSPLEHMHGSRVVVVGSPSPPSAPPLLQAVLQGNAVP